jgi:uncharacterized protein (DUF2141 family)
MGNIIKPYKAVILLTLMFFSISAYSQNIEANISGIRAKQGQIVIKVFKDEKSFQDDKPSMVKKFKKTEITNGAMLAKLTLEPGIYGLTLLDDENNDNEMNYSFMGIPKEGFGFSNFELKKLARPTFAEFDIEVKANSKYKVNMKVKYL